MLHEVVVEPANDEGRFQRLMQAHHYLGALPKIGETLWYVARWRDEWIALMSFSSPALKCRARDAWIGWDFRIQYDRLHLVTNNSRFLILPGWHRRNLASRLLSLCEQRLASDWSKRFGHPLLLLETFVDPARFPGTVYKAANWQCLGRTRGFRRHRDGYSPSTRKLVFVRPLASDARARMSAVELAPVYRHGGPKIMIEASMMRALPEYFMDIPDPRRRQGQRHSLATILALSAAAALCGMRSLKAKGEWVESLGEKARERFCCRHRNGKYHVPSTSVIVLVRVDPDKLDAALQRFNADYGFEDSAFAIDGKTLRGAVDDEGNQVHVISAVGHQTSATHVQKKVGKLPTGDEVKQTNEIGMVIPMLEQMTSDISGKTFTVDALLTQRKLAAYLGERGAFYVFTVKGNQPNLLADIELLFKDRGEPDFREDVDLRHGRIEERAVWVSTDLNDYLDFPDVGQVFAIERYVTVKKTGKTSKETIYTSHTPGTASPAQVLAFNRGHWTVENSSHYILDWNWDEDRQRIRTGYGPENTTRLRRFAIGLIKAKNACVASTIRRLQRSPRLVLDYLRMTENTRRRHPADNDRIRTN